MEAFNTIKHKHWENEKRKSIEASTANKSDDSACICITMLFRVMFFNILALRSEDLLPYTGSFLKLVLELVGCIGWRQRLWNVMTRASLGLGWSWGYRWGWLLPPHGFCLPGSSATNRTRKASMWQSAFIARPRVEFKSKQHLKIYCNRFRKYINSLQILNPTEIRVSLKNLLGTFSSFL